MRLVFGLLGVMACCTQSFAQNFPTSLVTNDKALACTNSRFLLTPQRTQ
jgi:hypothetical protein